MRDITPAVRKTPPTRWGATLETQRTARHARRRELPLADPEATSSRSEAQASESGSDDSCPLGGGGYGDEADTTLIKAHIRHLREKIERDPSRPRYIVTVAGSGYMLVRQPEQRVSVTVSAAPADTIRLAPLSSAQEAMGTADHQQALSAE